MVEGNRGVAVVLIDAVDGRAVPRRPDRPRVPAGRAFAVVTTSTRDVRPIRRADGPVVADVAVPPSKSIANRPWSVPRWPTARARSCGVARGDDTTAMLACLEALGCSIRLRHTDEGTRADVVGTGGVAAAPADHVAGQARRNDLAVRHRAGCPRRRPVHDRRRTAAAQPADGAPARCARRRSAPRSNRRTSGATCRSPCRARCAAPDAVMMPGDVSSQYVTALMLIAPYVPGGLHLWLTTPLVSRPYVADHQGGDGRVRHERGGDRRPADRGPARRVRADGVPGRARRLLGELPAGGRGDGRRRGRASRARVEVGAGRRPVRRRARVDGVQSRPPAPTRW